VGAVTRLDDALLWTFHEGFPVLQCPNDSNAVLSHNLGSHWQHCLGASVGCDDDQWVGNLCPSLYVCL
jgi:hypothetical protein